MFPVFNNLDLFFLVIQPMELAKLLLLLIIIYTCNKCNNPNGYDDGDAINPSDFGMGV
jgi:hypothetical protein